MKDNFILHKKKFNNDGELLMKEFKLSDKRISRCFRNGVRKYHYPEEDVKEFIKRDYKNLVLVKIGDISWQEYIRRREKLAGDLK